ncbi:siphovirus Gp157 family protein [Telmatobacter bradus]|uniref:siphovirus Gp157 family protein n=1 Tax=Telmatobacter bradus TaxID=474953 RepID=UPI003B43AFBA
MTDGSTLFEIDRELDSMLDQIEEEVEENGTASSELLERFRQFCEAESQKVDRIGRFLTLMDNRLKYCRQQAEHFQKRARTAEAKGVSTRNMVLYFLAARGLRKIEGKEFTLRLQKNSQDSVEITDATQVPTTFRELELRIPGRLWQLVVASLSEDTSKALASCIRDDRPNSDAIKEAVSRFEEVPGTQVKRGVHLRVA